MTSTVIYHKDKLKSAFGTYLPEQMEVLNKVLHLFKTMKFAGNKKKFLTGGIYCINAVIALQKHLKNTYGIPYFMTSRINQCYTERIFGRMRGMGNDSNPGPVQVLYRFQRILTKSFLDVSHLRNF